MNECCNCIPLDSEDVRRITCLYRLCKRIKDKGYTTSQIEQGENIHCEPEDICAIFSLYGFKCEFDSVKQILVFEW